MSPMDNDEPLIFSRVVFHPNKGPFLFNIIICFTVKYNINSSNIPLKYSLRY